MREALCSEERGELVLPWEEERELLSDLRVAWL